MKTLQKYINKSKSLQLNEHPNVSIALFPVCDTEQVTKLMTISLKSLIVNQNIPRIKATSDGHNPKINPFDEQGHNTLLCKD